MGYKYGILFIALLAGSLAAPPAEIDNDSDFFYHTDPSARLVGGTQAPAGSAPYMAAMTTGFLVKSFMCGGSVISVRTMLTAAHCIQAVYSRGSLVSSLRVTVGTDRWNSGGRTYAISRNITHPNYVHSLIKNDLGMLIFSTKVTLNARTQVLPLSFDNIGGGVAVKVNGWGRTKVSGGSISAKLMELRLNTITSKQCERDVKQAAIDLNVNAPHHEPKLEICTFHSANHGTCNGDSGSALVRVDQGSQIGIVSWGFPCARGAPDMFTRISGFTNWISQNIEF